MVNILVSNYFELLWESLLPKIIELKDLYLCSYIKTYTIPFQYKIGRHCYFFLRAKICQIFRDIFVVVWNDMVLLILQNCSVEHNWTIYIRNHNYLILSYEKLSIFKIYLLFNKRKMLSQKFVLFYYNKFYGLLIHFVFNKLVELMIEQYDNMGNIYYRKLY